MFQIKTALELTTAHGLPRMVTNKPFTVRFLWFLMFCFMLGLFLKGFNDFVVKLQSKQVTNTLDANSLNFQFPDVYACFQNPISGSYSANIDSMTSATINRLLNVTRIKLIKEIVSTFGIPEPYVYSTERSFSAAYPQSLPYSLLIDTLAHRIEQDLLTSDVMFNDEYGMPAFAPIEATTFYHPMYLSCLKWTLSSTMQEKIIKTGSSAGLIVSMNTDNNFTEISSTDGADIQSIVYARNTLIPVSDWSMSMSDSNGPERRAGIRVFLTPSGEYPSDYVSSFSLGPGMQHTVEIGMTQQVYKDGQFDCLSDAPDVQFVNPYDQTPYNHTYSYAYCYYYEYHKAVQGLVNMSGITGPLPWPLGKLKFVMNLTGDPTFFVFFKNKTLASIGATFDQKAKAICEKKRPCTTMDYSVSISSAVWPTQSSLAPFVSSSVRETWTRAQGQNLSVPALDFLMTANASSVASYVRSNMLKVHFKPHRVQCDQITLSIDYTLQSFISDVGGIIGIYLGMSLLTFFELFELIFDLVAFGRGKAVGSKARRVTEHEATTKTVM